MPFARDMSRLVEKLTVDSDAEDAGAEGCEGPGDPGSADIGAGEAPGQRLIRRDGANINCALLEDTVFGE